jgi:hypothetical protein
MPFTPAFALVIPERSIDTTPPSAIIAHDSDQTQQSNTSIEYAVPNRGLP